MHTTEIAQSAVLLISAIAAVTDIRTGSIPNWLTLPPLAAAPVAYLILYGPWGLLGCVVAAVVCGLVPYLLFRRGAAGGGDVKLLAAIGAVAGLDIGVEAQLITFMAAALFSLGRLAWRGKLFHTLYASTFLGLNPILPRRWRREVAPELMTMVRLGGFVLVGTAVALLLRHPVLWG